MDKTRTAILIDGAFFRIRADKQWGVKEPEQRADELFTYCISHIENSNDPNPHRLYRIFYYDCPPPDKNIYHPLTKKNIDYKQLPSYAWTQKFFKCLQTKRKLAMRLGKLSSYEDGYFLRQDAVKKLCKDIIKVDELTEKDFFPSFKQKRVDMTIGVDIASLTFKKHVQQIILISGDSDFVPAAKLARREGIDFIIDPMGTHINDDLYEHIDGLKSFKYPWGNEKKANLTKKIDL